MGLKIFRSAFLPFLLATAPGMLYGELLLSSNGIHFGPGDSLEISIGINQINVQEKPC